MVINNSKSVGRILAAQVVVRGQIPVFDLDGVLLDAGHRIHLFNEDDWQAGRCTRSQLGQLDLDTYRHNSTLENIALDKPLPLMSAIHKLNELGYPYHVATARVLCEGTARRLKAACINPIKIMHRQGDDDHRKDEILKTELLSQSFTPSQLSKMVLIDDLLANCKAVKKLGMQAVKVNTEYELKLR